jgi:paraquat-inducible protein B
MGRRGNPALVGGFVLGAAVLVVAAIVALGSGRLFAKTHPFISYFSGSVNGLSIGAAVKFRGVQIGQVTALSFFGFERDGQHETRVGVRYELDGDRIRKLGATSTEEDLGTREGVEHAVRQGLRAQLSTESILTGVLYVDLDFMPDTPATLILGEAAPVPEIPSVPTALEQAQQLFQEALQSLKGVDVRAIALAIKDAATGLSQLVNSPEIPKLVSGAQETLVDAQHLLRRVEKQVDPLAKNLGTTTQDVRKTLAALDETLATVQATFAGEAPVPVELRRALEQVAEAARAVRELSDSLERHPSSLLFGKPKD